MTVTTRNSFIDTTSETAVKGNIVDEISIDVADTLNTDSIDSGTSSSPMLLTPKLSTKNLISFWNNPHVSGTTVSFSVYNENKSTSISSNSKNTTPTSISHNDSIASLNYSPNSNSSTSQQHKTMLLDVSCDKDRNDDTESTTEQDLTDEPTFSNNDPMTLVHQEADADISLMAQFESKLFCITPTMSQATINKTYMLQQKIKKNDMLMDCILMSSAIANGDSFDADGENEMSSKLEDKEGISSQGAPIVSKKLNSQPPGVPSLPNSLPPRAPSTRNCLTKKVDELPPRESFVSIVDEKRPLSPVPVPSQNVLDNDDTIDIINKCNTTEESGDHDHLNQRPFSPKSELPPDTELDLTSIHSEDSDGGEPRNTRHHTIHMEHHDSLILHDSSMVIPTMIAIDRDEFDIDIFPQIVDDDIDEKKENIEDTSGHELNKSNDTAAMLVNVIDAAEKAMLNTMDDSQNLPQHSLMYFDCSDFDAVHSRQQGLSNVEGVHSNSVSALNSHIRSIPLDYLSEDCKEFHDFPDAISPTSKPHTLPIDQMSPRITPLHSNSSRHDAFNEYSIFPNTMDPIATVTSRKSPPRRKLLPKVVKNATNRMSVGGSNKRDFHSITPMVVEGEEDESIGSSSYSTLGADYDKEEAPDLFWIDAFLDFVSPQDDSRSVDSDSSISTATGSHGIALLNTDVSVSNTKSFGTDVSYSKRNGRSKKRTQTSISRLRDWWHKELVSEVMRGSLVKPTNENESDQLENTVNSNTVEKVISQEYHKAFFGYKNNTLDSDQLNNEQFRGSHFAELLESFNAALDSAKRGNIGCGTLETIIETSNLDQSQQNDSKNGTSLDKSMDTLDGLVLALNSTSNEPPPKQSEGQFQSMYEQLQQKLKDAHLFDHVKYSGEKGIQATLDTIKETASVISKYSGSLDMETVSDNSAKCISSPNLGGNVESKPNLGGNVESNNTEQCPLVETPQNIDVIGERQPHDPIYSPPAVDIDHQPTKRSLTSSGRALSTLTRAKEAISRRRRALINAAYLKNTLAKEAISQHTNEKLTAANEKSGINLTHIPSPVISCELMPENEDILPLKHSTDNGSSFILHDNVRSILNHSNKSVDESIRSEEEIQIAFNEVPLGALFSKTNVDKNDTTKDTAPENSYSDESINITSKLDRVFLSDRHDNESTDADNLNRVDGDNIDCDASTPECLQEDDFMIHDSFSANPDFIPSNDGQLDSSLLIRSSEGWEELGPATLNDSVELLASLDDHPISDSTNKAKMKRLTTRSIHRLGQRSSNSTTAVRLKYDDPVTPTKRIGFKSKALRRTEKHITSPQWKALRTTTESSPASVSLNNEGNLNSKTPDKVTIMNSPKTSLLASIRQKAKKSRRKTVNKIQLNKGKPVNKPAVCETTENVLFDANVSWEEFASSQTDINFFRHTLDMHHDANNTNTKIASDDGFDLEIFAANKAEFDKVLSVSAKAHIEI